MHREKPRLGIGAQGFIYLATKQSLSAAVRLPSDAPPAGPVPRLPSVFSTPAKISSHSPPEGPSAWLPFAILRGSRAKFPFPASSLELRHDRRSDSPSTALQDFPRLRSPLSLAADPSSLTALAVRHNRRYISPSFLRFGKCRWRGDQETIPLSGLTYNLIPLPIAKEVADDKPMRSFSRGNT